MKTCSKCGVAKELPKFSKNKKTADGLASWCMDCRVEQQRRYRKEGPRPKKYTSPICLVEGCSRPRYILGYCTMHHGRYKKYGDPMMVKQFQPTDEERSTRLKLCVVEGCSRKRRLREYCARHYGRLQRQGDPEALSRAEPSLVTAAEKKAFVRAYKLEKGCTDCGYNAHYAALDFDHLPGTVKIRDIKSGQQLGWQALLDEIQKCEVVCANCHRIRTWERRKEVMSMDTQHAPFELNGR